MIVGIPAGCAGFNGHNLPTAAQGTTQGALTGYLSDEDLPNSPAFLPPPPAAGSAALALDEEISRRSFVLRGTPRWSLAASDADLSFPHAAGTFSCALGTPVTEKDTPHLYLLLRRTMTDLSRATRATKSRYQRARPFLENQEPVCTPDEKEELKKSGSYPSGHSTVGWGWALILAEISPEQADGILKRGLAFGESRNVCNVHWHSDVMQGRVVAAAVVARLHADAAFRADLEAAGAELVFVRKRGVRPLRDCSAEAAALAIQPSMAQ